MIIRLSPLLVKSYEKKIINTYVYPYGRNSLRRSVDLPILWVFSRL